MIMNENEKIEKMEENENMKNKKEQLEKLKNNYQSIVAMLDTLIMEEFQKDFPDLKRVKAASDMLDKIAVVSSQSSKILVELLKYKNEC